MTDHRLITPYDDNRLHRAAFIGCLHWALGEPEILSRFRSETGNTWQPAKSPVDRMVDKATGADFNFMQEFSDWVAKNIYGMPDDIEDPATERSP